MKLTPYLILVSLFLVSCGNKVTVSDEEHNHLDETNQNLPVADKSQCNFPVDPDLIESKGFAIPGLIGELLVAYPNSEDAKLDCHSESESWEGYRHLIVLKAPLLSTDIEDYKAFRTDDGKYVVQVALHPNPLEEEERKTLIAELGLRPELLENSEELFQQIPVDLDEEHHVEFLDLHLEAGLKSSHDKIILEVVLDRGIFTTALLRNLRRKNNPVYLNSKTYSLLLKFKT